MGNLDELGQRHRELQAELDKIRPQIAAELRAEKAKGGPDATYTRLVERSGFRSIEGVKQAMDPDYRDKLNAARVEKAKAAKAKLAKG